MILPEADLAAAIPRRQFASLDAALKYFHHRLLEPTVPLFLPFANHQGAQKAAHKT
jgi:hypothetical protein